MVRNPLPLGVALEVRDACLCLHVQRAARALARRYDAAFRPLGLTSGQFSLLMALHRDVPVGISAVADLLGMDRTTITACLKPLVRDGLVAMAPGTDRRHRLLALTPAGRRRLAAALPRWRRTQTAVRRRLRSPARLRAELVALGAAAHAPAAHQADRCGDRRRG
jgi:DNA-binding MarR family transcriptional regulator